MKAATTAASPASRFSLRGTLIAVLVPLLIAASHQWVLQWFFQTGYRAPWQITVCYGLFVLQVGIAGAIAGRFIPGMLSWVMFGWTLLVIDLLTFCMAVSQRGGWQDTGKMLACALVSGQIGAVIVWGVLGEQRWTIRIALAGTLAILMLLGWGTVLAYSSFSIAWFPLLIMQSLLLLGVTVFMRWRGRSLRCIIRPSFSAGEYDNKSAWQFNLKDVFLMTTALAISLAAFRVAATLQNTSSSPFFLRTYFVEFVLVGLLTWVMISALWAVFGERRWTVRLFGFIGTTSIVGTLIGIGCEQTERLLIGPTGVGVVWWSEIMWFTRLTWWWFPWVTLASGFLAATLWIFRERGYRLVHR